MGWLLIFRKHVEEIESKVEEQNCSNSERGNSQLTDNESVKVSLISDPGKYFLKVRIAVKQRREREKRETYQAIEIENSSRSQHQSISMTSGFFFPPSVLP
jgi:hypothetical protein